MTDLHRIGTYFWHLCRCTRNLNLHKWRGGNGIFPCVWLSPTSSSLHSCELLENIPLHTKKRKTKAIKSWEWNLQNFCAYEMVCVKYAELNASSFIRDQLFCSSQVCLFVFLKHIKGMCGNFWQIKWSLRSKLKVPSDALFIQHQDLVETERKKRKPMRCLHSNHGARSLIIIVNINATFKMCTENLTWEFLPN